MPFLPVNMHASGLRVYYGGQRGNRIGGFFKPVLTRVAIPVAKCVVVLLAESIKSNWQESDELCSKESRELDTEKKHKETNSDPAKRQWSHQEPKIIQTRCLYHYQKGIKGNEFYLSPLNDGVQVAQKNSFD